ncbi:hypothetical protein [Paracoccus jeotgali]|uniref:hypothetical protein n=1 Tax=Paracoccus jeotgali TaxID=2065379 RepID=UPI0028AD7FD6|nr:hypothetical protein [Paracoccus jeotgali]
MPKLIRLYIVNIFYGFLLALVFTGTLVAFDVGHLRHLLTSVSSGWIAGLGLLFLNTLLFAGVQFAIAVMRMAEPTRRSPPGGKRQRSAPAAAIPALAAALPARKQR